ncbi:ABC-type transport auxiliary lipoprotein family protein [Marinobacter sp. SS13-12]|uniref:ABC-type transport auxiliary lipoprotein family protein n=1 Tax=Marinobacter sp. SS13-12 TaxID=3050451 RepID=UPI0025523A8E|nr:ABC-type transport auxiliary lipoprotein family protein [Marinobacter sp. SS13-12]MDK8465374.1 ABC-type transport auxiliary lipoprotein family protein [Marinobacter sp. SS13-12]
MTIALTRLLIATVATVSLAGCTVFPDQPAHQIFQLPAPKAPETTAETIDRTLRISTPLAVAPIDSSRILVKPTPHEIRAYQGSRWSNRAPVLVAAYLLEAFRRDGRMATVVTDTSAVQSDLTLTGDLTRFQAEYQDGKPVIHLELNLQLIDERSRKPVASKQFETSYAAGGESVESVVEAFGQASSELARQVINWTVAQI